MPGSGVRPTTSGRTVRIETVKHYVETVFYIRVEEGRVRPGRLSEWMGVSAPTITVTLQRLARDGWLKIGSDRSVSLTPKGETLAVAFVRVHRLLERWLTDVLGLDWAAADQEAQLLATGMSERVADRLDELLGHPATCPHGNVIPGREPPYGELVPLADLEPGMPASVRRVSEVAEHDAPELLRELAAYGLVTGARITVADADRSVQAVPVEVDGKTRPIGTEVAGLIWVEPEPSATEQVSDARTTAKRRVRAVAQRAEPGGRLRSDASPRPRSLAGGRAKPRTDL